MEVDLLIHNAAQVVTCASFGGPKRGIMMRDIEIISNGAVAICDGEIVAVGETSELRDFGAREKLDASGKVVCPGFVDPHTHVVYAGDRIAEFEMRIRGASDMEIMRAGEGSIKTVQAVRDTLISDLVAESRPRLDAMLSLGTTTVEAKSGYGLNTESELKMLRTIEELDAVHTVDLVPTFLGAHIVPPKYDGRLSDYVDLVIGKMLPQMQEWYRSSSFAKRETPLFCDVFCDVNVFDRAQAEQVLREGAERDMLLKIHTDEFENLGGVSLAAELGAVSVAHLNVTPPDEIMTLADSDMVGIILPTVNFNSGSGRYANARSMIDVGAAVALATDLSPGAAPCYSMPLVMAIACRYQKLLPAEALHAGTINAAHAVGLGHRVGSLEVGKQADVLIVNAPDYRHLMYQIGINLVERVIKNGELL